MPTHNRANLIDVAVSSVLRQTFRDYELIVVDDASVDGTEEKVRQYADQRILYVRHEQRKGGSAARNTGIRHARGELIAFLDDDDEWFPDKLEKQVPLFDDPEIGVAYTGYRWVDLATDEVHWTSMPKRNGWIYSDLLESNCVGTTSSAMVRRACLEEVGGFDEAMPQSQDWDLFLRLAQHYQFSCVEEILVNYYKHGGETITGNHAKEIAGWTRILEKHREDYERCPKLYSSYWARIGALQCLWGETSEGRDNLHKAIVMDPLNIYALWNYVLSYVRMNAYGGITKIERMHRSGRGR